MTAKLLGIYRQLGRGVFQSHGPKAWANFETIAFLQSFAVKNLWRKSEG